MTLQLTRIKWLMENLKNQYDPEHDIILDAPKVTYMDMQLIDAILTLTKECQELQNQIKMLKKKGN